LFVWVSPPISKTVFFDMAVMLVTEARPGIILGEVMLAAYKRQFAWNHLAFLVGFLHNITVSGMRPDICPGRPWMRTNWRHFQRSLWGWGWGC
jgi:hypothetical protein